jgi:hypothetical protein
MWGMSLTCRVFSEPKQGGGGGGGGKGGGGKKQAKKNVISMQAQARAALSVHGSFFLFYFFKKCTFTLQYQCKNPQLHIKLLDAATGAEIDPEATPAAEAWGFEVDAVAAAAADPASASASEAAAAAEGSGVGSKQRRELVILRGQAGVQAWEALQQQQPQGEGKKEGEGEGAKQQHVLRYRVVRNPPGITELRFAAK